MLTLRDPTSANRVSDPSVRRLVQRWFNDICDGEDYDVDMHGFVIVVELGDSLEAVETEIGCPLLHDLFGEPEPTFEALEEHDACYEMVFVPTDGDFGIDVFIPKADGIDRELLALCAAYAEPSPEEP